MATTKLTIKLLVDKKGKKVLFAEASKDFVDFLIGLLSLPLGSVIDLLTKEKMVGCIGNLYESVENLSSTYVQPNLNKESLLKPKSPFCAGDIPLLLPSAPGKYYTCDRYCNHGQRYMTDVAGTRCPDGGREMLAEITYYVPGTGTVAVASSSSEGGYVKGVVTYMVMDDLVVTPMSTISGITLLNKFNVENISCLEEMVVDITMKEGLELLRTSFLSKTVLSEVFLGKK